MQQHGNRYFGSKVTNPMSLRSCIYYTDMLFSYIFHVRKFNTCLYIMVASFEGHVDTVRMLIEANAEVNKQDEVCYSYH